MVPEPVVVVGASVGPLVGPLVGPAVVVLPPEPPLSVVVVEEGLLVLVG